MANYRQVYCKIWDDASFTEWDMQKKMFFLYILTNPNTTQAGVYQMPVKIIQCHLDMTKESVINYLNELIEEDKIRYNFKTQEIAIKNWTKYNLVSGVKTEKGIKNELDLISDKELILYTYPEKQNDPSMTLPEKQNDPSMTLPEKQNDPSMTLPEMASNKIREDKIRYKRDETKTKQDETNGNVSNFILYKIFREDGTGYKVKLDQVQYDCYFKDLLERRNKGEITKEQFMKLLPVKVENGGNHE